MKRTNRRCNRRHCRKRRQYTQKKQHHRRQSSSRRLRRRRQQQRGGHLLTNYSFNVVSIGNELIPQLQKVYYYDDASNNNFVSAFLENTDSKLTTVDNVFGGSFRDAKMIPKGAVMKEFNFQSNPEFRKKKNLYNFGNENMVQLST